MEIRYVLKKLIEENNESPYSLSLKVGVTQPTIHRIITGETPEPKDGTVTKLSRFFGVTNDQMRGRVSLERSNISDGPDIRGQVPLISWVKAGNWCNSPDLFNPGEADEFYPTTAKVGKNAYALLVDGDSMEPKFPHGCIIIVDPAKHAENGSFIVVRESESDAATFKQLYFDGSRKYLKPLNPRYPLMELREETVICGVVVKMEMDV